MVLVVVGTIRAHLFQQVTELRDGEHVGRDLVAQRGHGAMNPIGYVRLAARAGGGGAGMAAASIPANRVTTLADQYGYS